MILCWSFLFHHRSGVIRQTLNTQSVHRTPAIVIICNRIWRLKWLCQRHFRILTKKSENAQYFSRGDGLSFHWYKMRCILLLSSHLTKTIQINIKRKPSEKAVESHFPYLNALSSVKPFFIFEKWLLLPKIVSLWQMYFS